MGDFASSPKQDNDYNQWKSINPKIGCYGAAWEKNQNNFTVRADRVPYLQAAIS